MTDTDRERTNDPEQLLAPVKRACELLGGVSERWLWGATKSGLIPHVKLGTRTMYPVDDLQHWINAQKKGGDRQ